MTGAAFAPREHAPGRTTGSLRRSSHLDLRWDDAAGADQIDDDAMRNGFFALGALHLSGGVRDVRTREGGDLDVVAAATIDAAVGRDGLVEELETDPEIATDALVGIPVRKGFRRAAREVFPHGTGTPLGLLLDDLPVGALIAGYARLKSSLEPGDQPGDPPRHHTPRAAAELQSDMCAGWAAGGTMIQSILAGTGVPYRVGPIVGVPASADADGWHDEPVLEPGSMRRRRRIDMSPLAQGSIAIDAWFRDTWVDADGREEGLHEYTVLAVVDDAETIATITAEPHVLPFDECPAAAAFVARLVGAPIGELRSLVPERLSATDSCTHLNDLLRSLGDVAHLRRHLREVR